eukprot:4263255-Karenia_brevis.AAC.1
MITSMTFMKDMEIGARIYGKESSQCCVSKTRVQKYINDSFWEVPGCYWGAYRGYKPQMSSLHVLQQSRK